MGKQSFMPAVWRPLRHVCCPHHGKQPNLIMCAWVYAFFAAVCASAGLHGHTEERPHVHARDGHVELSEQQFQWRRACW